MTATTPHSHGPGRRGGVDDDTPVATIRPIARGEIAGVDDLVDFDRGRRRGRRTRRRRGLRIVRRTVLLTIVALLAYYGVTLVQVWQTGRSDQIRQVDAIVVMGAAQYDGRPSPQLAARLDHAIDLYESGVAPLVMVTGGKQPEDRFTEAEASARYLVDHGVPETAIVMETNGRSTYESMVGVAELLEDRGIERVLVVTDPFHSLRSRMIATDAGLQAYVSPTPTSVVRGGNELRRHLLEAGGVAVGRLIGFDRL